MEVCRSPGLAQGLQPRVLGEGLLPSLVGNLVGDRAVELQSHASRLVSEGLCDCLRVESSSRHGEAETVTHRVRVLLGNVKASSLSGLAEPFVEEPTAERFLRIPLAGEQKVGRLAVALLHVRLQCALQRLGKKNRRAACMHFGGRSGRSVFA